MPDRPWLILGAGRMGQTLGLLANRLGIELRLIYNRSPPAGELAPVAHAVVTGPFEGVRPYLDERAVCWLTVSDDAIAGVAGELAALLAGRGPLVMHCAGSRSSALLSQAGLAGPVGSLHPLQAITDPWRAQEGLATATWSVEGSPEALKLAHTLLARIGNQPIRVQSDGKALYHASAVTVAGLLVALVEAAQQMAQAAGISPPEARAMLLSLAHSSLDNLASQPFAQALSGPVARGDLDTLALHRQALDALDDASLLALYEMLTTRAARLAEP